METFIYSFILYIIYNIDNRKPSYYFLYVFIYYIAIIYVITLFFLYGGKSFA